MEKQIIGEGLLTDIHTRAVQPPDIMWPQNSVVPPLYQTAAYAYHSVDALDQIFSGESEGYTYTRCGNPTTEGMAQLLAQLEDGPAAAISASGMGAILVGILTLQPNPGPILLAREIYGGTLGLVRQVLAPLGYRLVWVDTHAGPSLEALLRDNPGVLIVETISNPLSRVSPLDELIPMAHQAGCTVLVDNTFATPYHATPLNWGADLVVHSVTKFIGGHSDLILGALVGGQGLIDRAANLINVMGITPDPYAAWLALRGARTMALRMERASENALALAAALKNHPAVDRINYPGLGGNPDYVVASRLLRRGFGAIFGLRVKGGGDQAEQVASALKLVSLVPSLGDVMTTVSHPKVASHRELSLEEQHAVGIDPAVLRVSVGIENVRDLIEDFTAALNTLLDE